jgi:hypothetical protein
MLDSPLRLVLGLLTGIAFGVLLQKGRVAKHGVIVGQLVLRDFTVLKIMLTAVAVGAVGFWSLSAFGVTEPVVKPASLGGLLAGAVLFGSGLAVLGYCPGTTVAAVGEGRRDAIAGLVGMFSGASVFVAAFPVFDRIQHALGDLGKITMPDVTAISAPIWTAILCIAAIALYVVVRRRRVT